MDRPATHGTILTWAHWTRKTARDTARRIGFGYMAEDLEAAGLLALVEAAAGGGHLSAGYLRVRIRGAVIDAARTWTHSRSTRRPRERLSWERMMAVEDVRTWIADPGDGMEAVEDRRDAAAEWARIEPGLSEREVVILRRIAEGDTLQAIAEDLGVTESRVCQIRTRIRRRAASAARTKGEAA